MNNKIAKTLIIGPAWIGDMVMAQTLFKLIKLHNPDAILDVFAPSWTIPILKHMEEINQAMASPLKHGELKLIARYKIAKQLKKNNYDQAIILRNSFKSALIPYWAKIPCRTGWRGEMRKILLNDMRILNKQQLPLMIQRFAALGLEKNNPAPDKLPMPKLTTSAVEINQTLNKLHLNTEQKILALCPGAEYGPAKRWPTKYFAELATHYINKKWQVWIFGSTKDQVIAAEIQQQTNNSCIDLTGKTSLDAAINLLSLAAVTISNDTGLMHIAAALNKPLIAIYGSSSPKFTPPLSQQAHIISLNLDCSPCFKRECPLKHFNCMLQLTPDIVLAELNKLHP